jgi:hypothetical protein
MILRKSRRTPVPKTILKEKGALSVASDSKITKKTVKTEQRIALQLITINPLLKTFKLDEKDLLKLSMYKLLFDL